MLEILFMWTASNVKIILDIGGIVAVVHSFVILLKGPSVSAAQKL